MRDRQKLDRVRAMPRAVAEADREVQSLACKINAVVVGVDAQIDVGMRFAKGWKARQHPSRRECADRADSDCLTELAAGELVERCLDAVEGFGEHRQQDLSLVRE